MLLQLNVRYKTRVAPKLTGIKRVRHGVVTMRLYDTARRRRSSRSSRPSS